MAGQGKPPDPVSELWERAADAILRRVYEQRTGRWYATRIRNPRPEHVTYFLRMWDIDVTGPDNAGTISGKRNNYRTRWNRAFVRAIYRRNLPKNGGKGSALQIQVGSPKVAAPGLPAGWAVRIRKRPKGTVPRREVDRIWTDSGERGGRFSDQNWDWL